MPTGEAVKLDRIFREEDRCARPKGFRRSLVSRCYERPHREPPSKAVEKSVLNLKFDYKRWTACCAMNCAIGL